MKDTDKPYSIEEIQEHIHRLRTEQSRVALGRVAPARLASTLQRFIDNLTADAIAEDRSARYWAIFQEVLSFELGFPDNRPCSNCQSAHHLNSIIDSSSGLINRARDVCRPDVDAMWPNRAEAEAKFVEALYAAAIKKYRKKSFWTKLFSR